MNYEGAYKIGKAVIDLYGEGDGPYKDGVCLWCGDSPTRHDNGYWDNVLHIDECWVGQFEKIVVEALDKPVTA